MQPERPRRKPDMRLDQRGLEADAARGGIDLGAGVLQDGSRFIVQEVDPDLFQHSERGLMDRFELVARNKLDRSERRLWLAQGLRRGGPSAPLGRARRGARFPAAANPSS